MKIMVMFGRHPIPPPARRSYAYDSGSLEVQVGDIVLTPPSEFVPIEQEATVVALETSYPGPLTRIRGLVERAAVSKADES